MAALAGGNRVAVAAIWVNGPPEKVMASHETIVSLAPTLILRTGGTGRIRMGHVRPDIMPPSGEKKNVTPCGGLGVELGSRGVGNRFPGAVVGRSTRRGRAAVVALAAAAAAVAGRGLVAPARAM